MKRFDFYETGKGYAELRETEAGPFVKFDDHIAALEAVKATVKPLEWVAGDGITADKLYFTAESIVGTYWVIECQWGLKGEEVGSEDDDFDSDESAKADAQAYHEQRILSAIVPSPDLEANQTGASLLDKYLDGPLTSIDRLKLFESDPEQWPFDRDDAENVLTALEANQQVIETLRAALEPFARKFESVGQHAIEAGFDPSFDEYECDWTFSFGDLRRARAALTTQPEPTRGQSDES